MTEFYSMDELYDYKDLVLLYDGDWNTAMFFLDIQTRLNYWITRGNDPPNIYEYMSMYKGWDGKYDKEK